MAEENESWIDRTLNRDLPAHIKRIREQAESSVTLKWLRQELHGTVLSFVGDIGAFAREIAEMVADHDDRLSDVEAFVEALGQETQLVPSDADDVAKLAGAMKLLASEAIKDPSQTEEGRERFAELIVLAERVEKMAATARLDAEPEPEDEPEEQPSN
jgi:dGTP triphosphohydrolase